MKKILITGGTGFIGSALALGLKNMNYNITAISALSHMHDEKVKELNASGIEFQKCDIFSKELNSVFAKYSPDVVIHAVGLPGFKPINEQIPTALEYHKLNTDSVLCTLNAAKKVGVAQFVYLSSASVYGKSIYLPIDEKHPTNPISPYGISKLDGEKLANEFRSDNMQIFISRIFNVYGPNQAGMDVVSQIINSLKKNKRPVLNGDGKQTRDFIYLDDVINAVEIGIMKKIDTTLNIATGKETSLLELANIIIKKIGSDLKPELAQGGESGIDRSVADVSNAKKFGIVAKVNLDEGIERLVKR